jgi:hypothetical protein
VESSKLGAQGVVGTYEIFLSRGFTSLGEGLACCSTWTLCGCAWALWVSERTSAKLYTDRTIGGPAIMEFPCNKASFVTFSHCNSKFLASRKQWHKTDVWVFSEACEAEWAQSCDSRFTFDCMQGPSSITCRSKTRESPLKSKEGLSFFYLSTH